MDIVGFKLGRGVWRMKTIRMKIIALAFAVTMITAFSITGISLYWINKSNEQFLNKLSDSLYGDYDNMVKQEIETAISMLQSVVDQAAKGTLPKAEAEKIGAELLRGLRYGQGGYFWADTKEGLNVVMLGDKKTEGKNRWDAVDDKGNPFIQQVIAQGVGGGGFSSYWFPKAGESEAKEKRSYSQYFEPFGWVVGTGNYIDDIEAVLLAKKVELQDQLKRTQTMIFVGSVLILAFSAVLASIIGSRISGPIRRMTRLIQQIGELKLTRSSELDKLVKNKDETGVMARSLEHMAGGLAATVQSISRVALELSSNAQQMTASAQENTQAVSQVTTTINELAGSNQHQAEDISHTSETLHGMSEHVVMVNRDTREGASLARKAQEAIGEGRVLLRLQTAKMAENIEMTRDMDEAMAALEKMIHEVNTIVGLIRQMAEQTHLLSLNAAIEAARAGEAGRGFAVVAHEIRKLAENAGRSTEEIGGHIVETTKRTGQVVDHIRKARIIAVEQAEALKTTDATFALVETSAREIVQSSSQVAVALENLNEASQEISGRSQNLAAAAQESAASMQEIAASTEEQMASMEMLEGASRELARMAEELAGEMDKFTV